MTSRGKGGRSTKTVTSIVSDCKFYCFYGDRGGREVWKWSFLRWRHFWMAPYSCGSGFYDFKTHIHIISARIIHTETETADSFKRRTENNYFAQKWALKRMSVRWFGYLPDANIRKPLKRQTGLYIPSTTGNRGTNWFIVLTICLFGSVWVYVCVFESFKCVYLSLCVCVCLSLCLSLLIVFESFGCVCVHRCI